MIYRGKVQPKIMDKIKIALISRYLFKNWWEALLKYVLNTLNLYQGHITLKCINGDSIDVKPWIFGRILHNYYLGYIRNIKCINGELVINDLVVTIRKDKYVHIGSVKFVKDHAMIYETFIKQVHSIVDVNGKIVVDIGAYVGDTPIYFTLRGANKVIAVEPNPIAYQEMLKNIKLNNLEDKIIPVNAGLSNLRGKICVRDYDVDKAASTFYQSQDDKNCVAYVDALTLSDITERYGVLNGVLKMDCEGCEYVLLTTPCQVLLRFTEIIIECHGDPNPLVNYLKNCGFRVSVISLRDHLLLHGHI